MLDPTLGSRMFLGSLLFLTIMTSAQVWGWSSAPGEEGGWSLTAGGGPWHRVPWNGGRWHRVPGHREKGGRDNSVLMRNYAASEGGMLQAILKTLRSLSKLRSPTMVKTDSNEGTTILRALRTPTMAKQKNRDRESRFRDGYKRI